MEDTVPKAVLGIVILDDIVERPVLEQVDRRSDILLSGNDDYPDIRVVFLDLLEYFGAITIGERVVQCHNIWIFMQLSKKVTRGLEPFIFIFSVHEQIMLQHVTIPYVIFNNKDFKRVMVFHICEIIGYDL